MLNFLISAIYIVIMLVILLGVVVLGKKYVFSKIYVNKFIPLGVAIIGFLYQFFAKPQNAIAQVGVTAVIIIAFFWFWDIQQTGGPKKSKEKKVVMKPKAKPNRIKSKDNK